MRPSALGLVGLGLAALVVGGWATAQYRLALEGGPLLRRPSGLVVDGDGFVYCGAADRRIHVYDPSGRLVRAWPVETGDGALRIRLDDAGRLEVATERGGRRIVYDRDGETIATHDDPGAFDRFGDRPQDRFTTPSGERFAFDGSAVVRTDPPPARVVVPPIPRPLGWFANAPWLLVALLAAGPVLLFAGVLRTGAHRSRAPDAGRAAG